MTAFAIDSDNNITAYVTPEQVPEGHVRFSGEKELAKISAEWPASRLVEIWNSLPGATPVKKFTDRKTAVIRILKAIQSLEPTPAPEAEAATQATLVPAEPAKPAAAREGSKKATVIDLLSREQGATIKEIAAATNWQAHSIRGFLSGTIGKKMGRRVESCKRSDGERAYSIAAN